MIPITNKTIAIQRLNELQNRTWEVVETGIEVYINQISEELVTGYDSEWAFFPFRMLTKGTHLDIFIWDRISDGENVYIVRGKTVHSNPIWWHHQYIILLPHE